MKTRHFIQRMAVMLVALMTGIVPSWAQWSIKETREDPGGGTYSFYANFIDNGIDYDALKYFETRVPYSFAQNRYIWVFKFRASPNRYDYVNHGTISLQTSDGKWHTVAEWHKNNGTSKFSSTVKDKSWGDIEFTSNSMLEYTNCNIDIQFTPIQRCFDDGVKRIRIEYDNARYDFANHGNIQLGDVRLEKDLNMTFADNEPIPDLDIDWADDYNISLKAKNVFDMRNNSQYILQSYDTYRKMSGSQVNFFAHTSETVNVLDIRDLITNEHDGMMDLEKLIKARGTSGVAGAYFFPMGFRYTPTVKICREGAPGSYGYAITLTRPTKDVIIDPFTRPMSVNVEFDKWTKKNIVSWTRNEEQRGWSTSNMVTRPCRTNGKWYIIRYDDGQSADTYTVVSELNGDATDLRVEDTNIDYDKKYNYRVIFLPVMLVDKYKDQLTSGMLASQGILLANFWLEKQANTTLEMPIKLTQDRSYDGAVRLKWEYCAAPTGESWTIEYRPAVTGSAWRVLDSSMMVDTEASEASFDAEGSVCDMMDYRVKTTYMKRDFYSNVYTGNLPAGSYISEVKASTGTEEKTVIVKWKVARADVSNEIYFRVLRRIIGNTEWTLLTDEIHGTASEYTYTDDRPLSGSYYEYSVQAYGAKCDEQIVKTDEVIAPGFSQARGTITGHISYGTGTAVNGVKVNLVKASADEQNDQPQFLSRYIEGAGKGLQWTAADKEKYANVLCGDGAFTLQFWARPRSVDAGGAANQTILRLAGGLELGVRSDDGQNFYLNRVVNYSNRTNSHHFNKRLPFSNTDFTHVTAVYDHGTLTCYVGTDTLLTATLDDTVHKDWGIENSKGPTLAVGGITSGFTSIGFQPFTGSIDDIRLWNRALTKEEVEANYTRILGGTEEGLILYWPLDEGLSVKDYAFDVARQDGIYQLNHPEVGVNTTPSDIVPQRLGLYGVTDKNGNYIIRGIPFQQGGTNYEIAPLYGEHQFNPATRSMFVSPTSLTANNIDFEDVSSFPMEGHIYYAGTNIPVEGVQMYVDGQLLTTDGEPQKTNDRGYYSISVPIGEHFVEAKLGGHTMVSGGRFPTQGRYDFNAPVTYDFLDSTLVNFVGRVSGGEKNDTLAVGFRASNNNIGTAKITLKLNNNGLSFNVLDKDHNSSATANREWKSDTTSINSTAWTGFEGSDAHYIYIQTDPETGEFSALLPPLKYITKDIALVEKDKNPDIEFTILPEIDLSNPVKEQTDSLRQATAQGDSVWNYYTYNAKMVQTYYATPQVDISQPRSSKGVFGIDKYNGEDALGKFTVSDLWTRQDDGTVSYKFGYPIYEMDKQYQTTIRGYEVYINYDTGTAVADTIPLNGQVLTISNEMSSEQAIVCAVQDPNSDYTLGQVYDLKRNQLVLDSLGQYTFKWKAGGPNVTAPYTRHLGVTMVRNNRTYVPAGLNAIVVGDLPMGNNFVTNGPDYPTIVLRDPPGSKSKTIWKSGTVTTTTKTMVNGGYGDEKLNYNFHAGLKTETHAGIGVSTLVSETETTFDTFDGLHYSWTKESSNETVVTTTATEQVSTGTGEVYVGSQGDVFIGYSTNLLLGTCRKVGFFRDNENAPFTLKDDVALSLGDSVKTTFMYSTYEIENVMMPKWKDTRNSYLTQHFDTEAEARAMVNNGSEVLYATWLKEDDPNYGQNDTYVQVTPASWETDGKQHVAQDEVMWCNDQINSWKDVLRQNEADKVKAIDGRNDYWKRNVSFDGGTSYSYTSRTDSATTSKTTYSHKLGYALKLGYTSSVTFGATVKHSFSLDTENGWTRYETESDREASFAEFDYVFDDGNRDTDFSVDIYKSPSGWSDYPCLFGGQSYNPYEGEEYTTYYKDDNGNPYKLSNGTVQMEQPDIQISTDGVIAAKSAVLTDVPAGGYGQFTLHLSNNTITNQGKDFTYKLSISERTNQSGLEILMDGVPIDGRGVYVPAGETVKKVITVRQTDQSVLDYENIELWFSSAYQPIKIHSIAKLSVHFKPSSSAVTLTITEPVLNTDNKTGELQLKLTNFDRQFKNLMNVGVQYRFSGNTQWTDLHTWVTDRADSLNAAYDMLPVTGDIRLSVDMSSDLSYPEGSYEFRGFTTTPYGTEQVQVYSDVVTVIKDMTKPRNLYVPAPSNGILGYGDELAVEFNEDIVPGYVGEKNVIVTAKLNQQPVNHEVSLKLSTLSDLFGWLDIYKTVNPIFLSGDFSMEFWLKWKDDGTILHQGAGKDNFALSIDEEGHAVASIAGVKFTSTDKVPKNEWTFFALAYKSSDMTFNMLAQYGTTTLELFKNEKVTLHEVQAIDYADDNYLYLGPIDANIHDLSLYNIFRDVNEAGAKKYQAKDSYVYGLTNYWPMNEGHGTVAADARHTHDFTVQDAWEIGNTNYALRNEDTEGVSASIATANTSRGDSYAIELWYHPGVDSDEEVVFETGSPTVESDLLPRSGKLKLYYDKEHNLILDYGNNSQTVASGADFYGGHAWHHMALNVVRGQAASFYLNGQRTAVIAETNVPMIQGSHITLGKGSWLNFIDEVRIWKATLSESRLLANMYNTIDTSDVYSRGLVAYYPFEKSGTVNGVHTKVETLENMAPGSMLGGAANEMSTTNAKMGTDAPPLKNAPDETRLIASPVASERKVVVNLAGSTVSARDIEGTTLNITLTDIRDLHGNTSDPIKWTAYVQQNTMRWTRDSVNVIKRYGADYTFDVDIENKSGQTEYYTLYNMPQWLSLVDSELSDDVGALKTKTLRFRVNPLVAVGNYDVTIGLQGNNEILEPLRIVMKVRGEKPDWAVDPTKYDHSMTIIGQVYIDGILMENEESMVAAFIGGKCRGVAHAERVRGAAYVTLNIYGNDTDTEDRDRAVTFRIWDASKGVAYTDANLAIDGAPVGLTFQQDRMIGNFDTPAIWTKTDRVEQLIPIHENWNWIAFGVEPESPYLDHIFGSYADWMLLIKSREAFSDYNGAEWNGTLVPTVNAMYKLKVSRLPDTQDAAPGAQLSVSGRQPMDSEMPVTLRKGWNWIAYTPLTTMTIGEALAGANPQRGDILKSQTGVAIYGSNNWEGSWEGSLQSLESGHGYLYYSTDSEEKRFVYPAASSASAARMRAPRHAADNALRIFTPIDPSLYPNNMTMVIQLKDGAAMVDTCEVAAFVGDECRGATRAESNGLYYLVISGEGSGQPMTLSTCLNGEIVTIDEMQSFVSDDNIGTSWNPYVIDLSAFTGIGDISVDNTEDDDWWTLQGFKIGRKPTYPGVYIHKGNKVTIWRTKQ